MNRFCSQNPLVQACRWQGPDASHHAGTPSVAVIGAGVSGLNCAKRLQPTCDLVVLEASDGVGGRVRSDREGGYCPVPLTVRGTQALVSFAPLAF